jgi:excisionase family DNA binding protein
VAAKEAEAAVSQASIVGRGTEKACEALREVFAATILDLLDTPEVAEAVASKLEPFVKLAASTSFDGWIGSQEADEYLGITRDALHKLTAAHRIPFHQDVPRGKCWFQRSQLDGWRRSHEGRVRFHGASTARRKCG